MKQQTAFLKIEAAGNDFICLDGTTVTDAVLLPQKISALCDRRRGIGADGLIYLTEEDGRQIRMNYFNADGSRGEMCGNGLRAATLFAVTKGSLKKEKWQVVLADDGRHGVFFSSPARIKAEIFYKPESYSSGHEGAELPPETIFRGYLNTGVPHIVLQVDSELTDEFIESWGKRLRYAAAFQPQGANVNFLRKEGPEQIFVRTYERGVEAETLACGSGVTACAILFWGKDSPGDSLLHVRTRGGRLLVSREKGRLFLQGPARIVFEGVFNWEAFHSYHGGGNEKNTH